MLDEFAVVQDGRRRNATRIQAFQPVLTWLRCKRSLQDCLEILAIDVSRVPPGEPWIVGYLLKVESGREPAPELLIEHNDHEPAPIAALVVPDGRRRPEFAGMLLASMEEVENLRALERHLRAE